jgi:type II secretory pathway pseudopilin PulG
VELLVVAAVIVLLIGILLVAVNAASSRAQAARTSVLMHSIRQALVQFEGDHGYYPPVLGAYPPTQPNDYRNLMPLPQNVNAMQEWRSYTTLAEYLLGYGPEVEDGHGGINPVTPNPPWTSTGAAWTGIRSPGPDQYWGAAAGGTLADRRNYLASAAGQPLRQGRVYSPYLTLRDESLLGAITGYDSTTQRPIIVPATDDAFHNPDNPKVILDYWGEPLVYYRRHQTSGLTLSLENIFALRPFDLQGGTPVQGAADVTGDAVTTFALRSASFGILSYGPDRQWNPYLRYDDPDFFNRDNIREVGP